MTKWFVPDVERLSRHNILRQMRDLQRDVALGWDSTTMGADRTSEVVAESMPRHRAEVSSLPLLSRPSQNTFNMHRCERI